MNETPLFSETRGYDMWVNALMLVALGGVMLPLFLPQHNGKPVSPGAYLTIAGVGILLVATYIFMFRQRVSVYPGRLVIALGYVELWRKGLDLSRLETVEAVTFNPLLDFGGWGVKRGREGYWCYNTKGKQGVRLTGERIKLVIGSDDPVGLAAAIEKARGNNPGAV